MIIEIVGKPRAGKTALNTLFMLLEEHYNGETMLGHCNRIIMNINKDRAPGDKIPLCTQAPIYANYESHIRVGFDEILEPYFLNPYKLGIANEQTAGDVQYILPCSCLHITEGRKYWDGRDSSSLPDNVSQWFETHGHNYMTIIIDAQRGKALDLNIRENVTKFIEVQYMLNDEDAYGRIIGSTWYCREFYSLQDYEAYVSGKAGYYSREVTFHYDGNIFEYYKSRNREEDFIPPKGIQYSTLKFVGADELKRLPKSVQAMYNTDRPEYKIKAAA